MTNVNDPLIRRQGLDQRITFDPYDLAAILERILLASATGDRAVAATDTSIFSRIGLAPAAIRTLKAVSDGTLPCSYHSGIYIVGSPVGLSNDDLLHCMASALATISNFSGRDAPVLWIDFADGAPYENVTRVELPGICRATLSMNLVGLPDWHSIVWHEAAHVALMSGCRFLDEGWAVWCQYQFISGSLFPVADGERDTFEIPARIANLPLHRLLEYKGSDLVFGDLAETEREWRAIYVRAYRYIDALLRDRGIGEVTRIFDAILAGETVSLPDPTRPLSQPDTEVLSAHPIPELAAEFEIALRRCLLNRDLDIFRPYAESLREDLKRYPNDVARLRLLGRYLARLLASADDLIQAANPGAEDELNDIIKRLELLGGNNATLHFLKGLASLANVSRAHSWGARAELVYASERQLQHALSCSPTDADVLLSLAQLELRKPSFARNVVRAVEYIALARGNDLFSAEAQHLAEEFDVVDLLGRVTPIKADTA